MHKNKTSSYTSTASCNLLNFKQASKQQANKKRYVKKAEKLENWH